MDKKPYETLIDMLINARIDYEIERMSERWIVRINPNTNSVVSFWFDDNRNLLYII